jgi:hypothetical protein
MRRATITLLSLAALLGAACGEEPGKLGIAGQDDGGSVDGDIDGDGDVDGDDTDTETVDPALAARTVDYNEALRTASLKLVRRLPTLDQIRAVERATDPRAAYEAELDAMLESPAFASRMVKFWRDTMRMGGEGLDTAPVLAAQLMVEGGKFSDLFTLTTGNCPTFDGETGTFAAADCASGAPVQAGVLTDPAVMRQFYGNMAFRRVRWVQEVFFCSKFPAEVTEAPTQMNGKDYTSPWAFESISAEPINFQDTQSVVCANCHTSMNHIAPLFANFDADGMWQGNIAVMTPLAPEPVTTELSHWLPAGQPTAWRMGQEVADLAELGEVLSEDPALSECMVARMWNWSMSKEDIVTDLATVPYGILEPYVLDFDVDRDLKKTLRSIMTSEDFISF